MFKQLVEKIIGTYSSRELKRLYPLVDRIEAFADATSRLTDDELRQKTAEFRRRLGVADNPNALPPGVYGGKFTPQSAEAASRFEAARAAKAAALTASAAASASASSSASAGASSSAAALASAADSSSAAADSYSTAVAAASAAFPSASPAQEDNASNGQAFSPETGDATGAGFKKDGGVAIKEGLLVYDDDPKDSSFGPEGSSFGGETLDDIMPEAFAVVREAAARVLGERHYPVQLLAGVVLHQGRIAEMKTGEGKTLVATLPVYLNALTRKGVHVVTVNDYLAKYQGEWMGKVYSFLGLSVGLILHGLENSERRVSYACDVTYGTNNEFGFDYLRDNMVVFKEELVQRKLVYAIVDEVDSILVDEARTPLIISGRGDKSTDLYKKADALAKRMTRKVVAETDSKDSQEDVEEDYIIDEKARTATLTSNGVRKAESYFGVENLSDMDNITISHHINQAIKANGAMRLDRDYVVKDGQVIIVDEFTGRLMYGRRYNEGLHQAIEAKEGVNVEHESKTLATITFQNYFRLYEKLSGMTGTALTEEQEFQEIYKLDIIEVPTNKPMIRVDLHDCVLKTEQGKFRAVIEEVAQRHSNGQPVLIGTISIEKSEELSAMLKKRGVKHEVLNAKQHEREAEIVAQAGRYGAVTIATNMAGRGTDILLGGNASFLAKQDMRKGGCDEELIIAADSFNETDDEKILDARSKYRELIAKYKELIDIEHERVVAAGGLCILGTERHESRRIDNQLRGRSGRQGDPGVSKFYISLDDDLMRLFGSDRLTGIVNALGLGEDDPIEHRMLSNAVETAQRRVENRNFETRKHVLKYDDVMNQQREVIYKERYRVLEGEDLRETFRGIARGIVTEIVDGHTNGSQFVDDWDLGGMEVRARMIALPPRLFEIAPEDRESVTADSLKRRACETVWNAYERKEAELGADIMREVERVALLRSVDEQWMDHIDAMDQMRHSIGMRAYAQRDPIVEYKFEGFAMFEAMTRSIHENALRLALNIEVRKKQDQPQTVPMARVRVAEPVSASHGDNVEKPRAQRSAKVGRNDPCPCGSGKKYKNCHGAGAE